ncbi:MAG: presqualene diphosphate synthase HpnD [Rhodospirillaceae bacterium]
MLNQPASHSDGAHLAAAIEAKVKSAGSSFYWAMLLLSPEKRAAMYAVYAFCREVDDIADEPAPVAEKRAGLEGWRLEIDRVFDGSPETEIGRALAGPVQAFGLVREDFRAVIDGMETDAAEALQLADAGELVLYCDRVACAVGRLSNKVFGLESEAGNRLAKALGEALQITNILRDVAEDAARGRVYLPADLLNRHGIQDVAPAELIRHPGIEAACLELAETTATRYREASEILSGCDRKTVRPARIMMHVYRAIFKKLRQRGWRRLDEPVSISKLRKVLAVIFGYW